jgi:nicotinate phosphoribosyltransferase
MAAGGDDVIEFGLRRSPGLDGGLIASRASYIGGCDSTSNVLAGKLFGIPVKGTHSHSWVMSFDKEIDSFRAYASAMPENCVLLVDTYSTLEGVKNALTIKDLAGIRLDSGDLSTLSKKVRKILDKKGLKKVVILGSGDLDEYSIEKLKKSGSPISVWGVGTKLVASYGQAVVDVVYKMGAIEKNGKWEYKMKLSDETGKATLPGIFQIRRFFSGKKASFDVLFNIKGKKTLSFIDLKSGKKKAIPKQFRKKDLLIPIFKAGKCVYKSPALKRIREFAKKSLDSFSHSHLKFKNPKIFPVGMDSSVHELRKTLRRKSR